MRGLAILAAAVLSCGCRPWCAMPAALWSPSLYGPEAGAVAATDGYLAAQAEAGRDRPAAELDAAARAAGADDAAELAAIEDEGCLPARDLSRFARARGLSEETASAYLFDRFGVAPCRER